MIRGALEWTSTGLQGAAAARKGGRWRIVRLFRQEWSRKPEKPGFVRDPLTDVADLKAMTATHGLWNQTVYCVLPRSEAIVLRQPGTADAGAKTLQDQLPWPLEQTLLATVPVRSPKEGNFSLVIAAHRDRVVLYEKAITAAGMLPGGFQLSMDTEPEDGHHEVASLAGAAGVLQILALEGPKAFGAWIVSPDKSPAARHARRTDRAKAALAGASVLFVLLGLGHSWFQDPAAGTESLSRPRGVRLAAVLGDLFQAIPADSRLVEFQYDSGRNAVQLRGRSPGHGQASQLLSDLAKATAVRSVRGEKTSLLSAEGGVEFSGEVLLR